MARLQEDAAKGSVSAARELRAYLAEVKPEPSQAAGDLDTRTRARVMALCLALLEAEPGSHWEWTGERLVPARPAPLR